MQVQTTTITTESTQVLGANFQITTFEMTVTAFCDCCDKQDTASEKQLVNQGWSLSANCQFCPNCND